MRKARVTDLGLFELYDFWGGDFDLAVSLGSSLAMYCSNVGCEIVLVIGLKRIAEEWKYKGFYLGDVFF